MKQKTFKEAFLLLSLIASFTFADAQEISIRDLDFLIGSWEVREDNEEKTWWEKSTRTGRYTLDSTYIELKSVAVSSSGKERTYLWLIHYNAEAQQFEMVSMFSNWPKILLDILHWDPDLRKLSIRNEAKYKTGEYHERFGELLFEADFNSYTWKGVNKYGDRDRPSIWKYVEKGTRIVGH